MGYRKVHVNDKEYEYTIGKKFVKIKGVGSWPKKELAKIETFMDWNWMNPELSEEFQLTSSNITPADIIRKIKSTV